MPSGNGTVYRVNQLPAAENQLLELALRAVQQGSFEKFVQAVSRAWNIMGTRPATWGEPTYHPKKLGSEVRHSAVGGLMFEYVVFDPEHVVIVLNVKPLPGSPWHE